MSRVSISSGILSLIVLASVSATPLRLAWRYPTGGQIRSSPAIGPGGTIYALSDDGYVYAFSKEGRVKWACNLGGLVADSLSVGLDGTVYAGLLDGTVDAINPRGRIIWQFASGGGLLGNPATASDGTVFIATTTGTLYSVSLTGTLEWRITLPASMTEPPVLDNQGTLYLGGSDGRFYALTRWGRFKWSLPVGGVPADAAVAADGTIYLLVGKGNSVELDRISPEGNILWTRAVPSGSHGVLVGGGRVFTANGAGQVMSFDSSGRTLWRRAVGKVLPGAWVLLTEGLALMGSDKQVTVLDRRTGTIASSELLDAPGSMAVGEGELLIGGRDWLVYGYKGVRQDPEAQWPQGSADARHSSRAPGRIDRVKLLARLETIPDYLALSLQLNLTSRSSLDRFLGEVAVRTDGQGLGKSTWYVRRLLERTVGVGVLNPIVEGNSVVNDFPSIRARAAQLLGRLGSLGARTTLIQVLAQEDDAVAASNEIVALGAIGSDSDGGATNAIAAAVRRFSADGGGESDRVALSAVRAIQSIAHYEGDIPSPEGGVTLLSIYRGGYPESIRNAALAALRNHSP